MSDGFDTNLLSQVTALDKKLSISKERINLANRKGKHEDHRRNGKEEQQETTGGLRGQADRPGTARGDPGRIDITI